jgi:tRNA A-37 threonylcarbamoyl transferase component Bud32
MSVASVAELVEVLRRYHLPEPAQQAELAHRTDPIASDPDVLARDLVGRDLLTPFQVERLFQGLGSELLLGSYVLLDKLGEGGMGAVFKARHWKLGRLVALKVIRAERLGSASAVRRFRREILAAAQLEHPHIVRALDAEQVGDVLCLVLEHVAGTDLKKRVQQHGPLPVGVACEYVRQAALGLQHAHDKGLVHRDVKPSNLLVTADHTTVKVLDLGLARLDRPATDEPSSTMTREGMVVGTSDYMAPEQALESHTVDIRADIYSLGCTLYFLLAGQVPFPGGSMAQKLLRHQSQQPRPIEQVRAEVPPAVAAVVRKAMAKEPEERYQTPAELAAALAAIALETDPSPAASDTGQALAAGPQAVAQTTTADDTVASPFAAPVAERHRRLLYGVAGGLLLLAVSLPLLLLFLLSGTGPAPSQSETQRPPPDPEKEKFTRFLWEVYHAPVASQAQLVARELQRRNPRFDGVVQPKIDNDRVVSLELSVDEVTDLTPVQALPRLTQLICQGSAPGKGKLVDLTPLKEMKLTDLRLYYTPVSDLTPLKGLPLTILHWVGTPVSDLSPLQGLKLTYLSCQNTPVADLSPLVGMPLTSLQLARTKVTDLAPLKGLKLMYLSCQSTPVADLSPLKGMKLAGLNCRDTKVFDLTPLKAMPLKELWCDFKPERDTEVLQSLTTLERINDKPAQEFWKEVNTRKP